MDHSGKPLLKMEFPKKEKRQPQHTEWNTWQIAALIRPTAQWSQEEDTQVLFTENRQLCLLTQPPQWLSGFMVCISFGKKTKAARQPFNFDSYLQNWKTATILPSLVKSRLDCPPLEWKVGCDLSEGLLEKTSRIFLHISLFSAAACKQIITHHELIFYIWHVAVYVHPDHVYTTSTSLHFLYQCLLPF